MADDELEAVFRETAGRCTATLVRILGDVDLAEDAVSEAFAIAAERWPIAGLPPNPGGWITTTARNRAIDRLRRESTRDARQEAAHRLHESDDMNKQPEHPDLDHFVDVVPDDQLRLMFLCCHPALSPDAQVALTLRLLGGLDTKEIAQAFVVPEPTIAQRLVRAKRKLRDNLTDLAEETGISASTLSRLEAGLRHPTLEQILPLASAYGVTLDDLVDAPPTGNPRITLRPIRNKDGSTIIPLTRRVGGIQAYKFVLPAASDNTKPELRTHEGYDWVYVLDGQLRLVLGEHDLLLQPGEVAEFDTRTPHWFGATSSGPVEFLSLIGKQGEKAHVRAAPRPNPSE